MLTLTPEKENNLRFFMKMLSATTRINSFLYDENMNIVSSYTDWENQIRNFFLLNCPLDLKVLLQADDNQPILFSDEMNLCWIVQPLAGMECLLVLGPAVESDLTFSYLQKQLSFNNMSVRSRMAFMKMTKDIPVISLAAFMHYGTMLHYGIYEELCEIKLPDPSQLRPASESENVLPSDTANPGKKSGSSDADVKIRSIPGSHGSRTRELQMLANVRNGVLKPEQDLDNLHMPEVGVLSQDDPMRQARNLIISQVTTVTRAAVDGGMDPEDAYSLSDYYIQKLETLETVQEVYQLSLEMVRTFTQAVRDAKEKNYSSIVKYLRSWISKHADQEIRLQDLGAQIGYDPYYITKLFHEETGQTIKSFILEQKVEQAQILLRTTLLSVQEISDLLSFRSPSYFATRFKKQTGMTPAEYRKKTGE